VRTPFGARVSESYTGCGVHSRHIGLLGDRRRLGNYRAEVRENAALSLEHVLEMKR